MVALVVHPLLGSCLLLYYPLEVSVEAHGADGVAAAGDEVDPPLAGVA